MKPKQKVYSKPIFQFPIFQFFVLISHFLFPIPERIELNGLNSKLANASNRETLLSIASRTTRKNACENGP